MIPRSTSAQSAGTTGVQLHSLVDALSDGGQAQQVVHADEAPYGGRLSAHGLRQRLVTRQIDPNSRA
ncbi:hypothetical protein EGV01_18815 [Pseudomonas syringae pv. theae]|nr:hypothetical protein [Pseudomonas syringae pv. theae]